jgi:lysophospholipase
MGAPFSTIKTARDITLRYGFWPSGKPVGKGSVLLLNGRGEFMEKHLETVRELNDRGLDVYGLDWRGQGGSSRELQNPHKGFVRRYEDYLNDLSVFYRDVICRGDKLPKVILAHSMGGHIALRYLGEHPEAAERAVLTSPMIDIHTAPMPPRIARMMARIAGYGGLSMRYCPGAGDYAFERIRFKDNRLTSDAGRFWDEHTEIQKNPQLALGGVTWGWLAATFQSIGRLTGAGTPEQLKTPVLMLCAQNDRVVSMPAQRSLALRIPGCGFVPIPGARHEILKETDTIRRLFWKEFDAFVGVGVQA